MSMAHELRRIDYYEHYSTKIQQLDRFIRQQSSKGHGHFKLKEQTRRLYRNGGTWPKGMHDYNNLQWDPSIFRGRTFRDFREKNLSPNATTVDFNKYCCIGCNTTRGSRSNMNRRKTVVGLPRMKVGGVIRPTTNDIIFEESSGRKRHKQDESKKEMEPFIIEQLEPPEYAERGSQADETKEKARNKCHRIAIGTSIGSQADICIIGTGSHEDPLGPILSNMGSKVLEQSLLETFEDYELHAIRTEIRGFVDRRRYRQARQMKHVENQLFKAEMMEKERVRRESELKTEMEANEMVAAIFYSINACNGIMSHTFHNLREHKYLVGEKYDAEIFIPLVHQQMYRHLQVPRMVLNDIIHNLENEKFADFNLRTLLNGLENIKISETEEEDVENSAISQSEEEDDFSSLGPPPNTASSLPNSTSEGEEESIGV